MTISKRRKAINTKLLAQSESILSLWLKGEFVGKEFVAINPTREDSSEGSFKINLKTGVWKDFAAEDFSGPDLVSLYMTLKGFKEPAALTALEKLLSAMPTQLTADISKKKQKPKPEVVSAPAPTDCHLPPDMHPDLGPPSKKWAYKTAEGETAFYVYRFETEKGKETRPVSYNPERSDWQWKLPASPLPIYNLNPIKEKQEAIVIVVEGEKAADAATCLFPEHVCTTSASGSSNALKSEWGALYEREVIIVPDADEPGTKYAMTVAAELLANQSQVFIVDTLSLGWRDGEDVADYADLDEQWLADHKVPLMEWIGFKQMDDVIVGAIARLSPLDYDRRKDCFTELLGNVGKRTLDKQVNAAREKNSLKVEAEEDNSLSIFANEEPWSEPVDGKALITEIQSIIRGHVILSSHEALAVALWVVLTYVFRAFRVCPRLLVSSPEKRCGKTTLLETIQALCFRGLAAANISAAALFRSLEAWEPTLLIDEADTFLHGNDELRGILNSGHTKSTAYVIRSVGDDHEPKRFPTFAPIAIGMIKTPPDTLLDRSIVIRLQRKLGVDAVTPLPLEVENDYLPIRQKCLRWASDNAGSLQGDRALTPADVDNDRAKDNWIPLMAIALQCNLLDEVQEACRALTLNEEDSLAVMLLKDIRVTFREEGKDKLQSKVLVKALLKIEESPWSEYSRGKSLTQAKLANLLKGFGVHTGQVRVGKKNLRHYCLADFEPLFERYLNDETPLPKEAATPLQQGVKSRDQRVGAVAGSQALPRNKVSERATLLHPRSTVAHAKNQPLQGDAPKAPPAQASQDSSAVAGKSKECPAVNSAQPGKGEGA